MKELETILKKENYDFKVIEQISDGETSQIFLGEFNNTKSIFKLSKKNKFKLIINEYLKNEIIKKIVTKNITPKILFHDLHSGLIIYDAVDLFNELNVGKENYVLSHNDLNSSNVMFKNNKIVFIDFEYLSINSKYSDLSKLIDSFNLKTLEKNKLLKGYGVDEINDSINIKIQKWSLMNIYTELIWANYINEYKRNYFDKDYINLLKNKIKQQKQ